jgi:hypothetical protein
MTVWDLNRLRYSIRKITGKYDTNQLPDTSVGEVNISNPAGIDDYINDFYLYDMPEHFRTLKLRDFYTFSTIPNCGTYAVPENVYEIYDPIYIDNYQFRWYQYPQEFYQVWPELNFIDQNRFTPTGAISSYTFTLTQTPIQQGTVVIGLTPNIDGQSSGALETFTDHDQPIPLDIPQQQFFANPGTLISNQYSGPLPPPNPGITPGTGTIDYLTGSVTVNYKAALGPPNGTTSSCHYHPYVASRSRDILFWQQNLYIRPIPNDTYFVKCMAYMMPTTVISAATNATIRPSLFVDPATSPGSSPTSTTVQVQGFTGNSGSEPTDLPQFNEWWQLISYGASIKIFIEDGDWEEANRIKPIFEEQKMLAQRKTLRQLAHQRIPTVYSSGYSRQDTWPIFPIY